MWFIKALSRYGFQVSIIVADGTTEYNSYFEGMANDSSISVLTTDTCVKKCLVESSKPYCEDCNCKEKKEKGCMNKHFS